MSEKANMAARYEHEIPEGYEARIEGNKVIIELKESDDERIKNLIYCIVRDRSDVGKLLEANGCSVEKALSWIEKQKEQKPAEWSDEDDAIYTRVLGILGKAFMGVIPSRPSQEDIEWFKSLPERFNLQPKQEWSEENKNKIESIKGLITTGKFVDTNTIRTIWKLLDSLRPQPHWRPGKEQMKQ